MSEVELVKELNGWKAGTSDDGQRMVWLMKEAADTITRLLKERDEATKWKHTLTREVTIERQVTSELKARAEAAEAQVAALREILAKERAVWAEYVPIIQQLGGQIVTALDTASRKALEASR